jgi:hypothetical protein
MPTLPHRLTGRLSADRIILAPRGDSPSGGPLVFMLFSPALPGITIQEVLASFAAARLTRLSRPADTTPSRELPFRNGPDGLPPDGATRPRSPRLLLTLAPGCGAGAELPGSSGIRLNTAPDPQWDERPPTRGARPSSA